MHVIEAAHYEETRQRLAADPIVKGMAKGLANVPRDQMVHDSGTPRFEFMLAANVEYHARGGKDTGHIGAVAEALLRLLEA